MNDKPKSSVIIHEENEEEEDSNEPMNDAIMEYVKIPKVPVHTHPFQETIQEQRVPPFPERLVIEKGSFMVVESKDPSKGHPIILGIPWLATANAFIGCRGGEMTQTLILYPAAQPITKNSWWLNCSFGDEDFDDLSLPSDFSLAL